MGTQTKTNNAAVQKTKEFTTEFGNKFTFQKVTPSKWLKVLDDVDQNGSRSRSKLYPAVLENVVVSPAGLAPDDFDDEVNYPQLGGFAELDEVVTAAIRFQQGK